jgi:hypothetical protein
MSKCSECGKTIKGKDSVYKDEGTGEVFCGVCYIKHLEEDIGSPEEDILDIEPVKTQSRKFMIILILGIILIIAEILMLSETSGGRGPAHIPEKKEGAEEAGSIATRTLFIRELLMNYKAKHGEYPVALSLLTPEFIEPEINDANIVYELEGNFGFVLYSKDSEGEVLEPILSSKGKIELSELKTIYPQR